MDDLWSRELTTPNGLADLNPPIVRKLVSMRVYLLGLGHLVVFASAYWLAFAMRFDFAVPARMTSLFWTTLIWMLPLKLGIYYLSGHYHGWWRYVTLTDLVALLRASTISLLLIAATDYLLIWTYQIPRTVLIMDWAASILLLGGLRCAWRLSREQLWPLLDRNGSKKALILGSNHSGEALARQIQANPELKYRVVGFLDSDSNSHGLRLGGVPVLGGPGEVIRVATDTGAQHVLVVAETLPGERLRPLMRQCHSAGLTLKVIPSIDDLLKNGHRVQLRDLDINDLLHRDPVKLEHEGLEALLEDRTVLVTGAGGTIGSEICRQVLNFHPKKLILMDRTENSLFEIERQLQNLTDTSRVCSYLADLLDKHRVEQIFSLHRPEVVFHAAAHKHVPIMEVNPSEAIKNNVFGTKRLVDLADRYATKSFVLISSDKAVNPCSIMGVSKLIAEKYVRAKSSASATRFMIVRFCNVLGSSGSVVPIFQEQLRRGGPLTVTHPDMTRFFMTTREACQLVLQAASMGLGGETFVLDVEHPVRIVDLARDLICLSGLSPEDIEIVFTGPRAGERFFETLYGKDEESWPTHHPNIRVVKNPTEDLSNLRQVFAELRELLYTSPVVIRRKLRELVSEYDSSVFATDNYEDENSASGAEAPAARG